MSYLVLARKYRPQTFEEVVGQGHVSRTLTNAISNGRVAHAIMFSGPRGTGKTTVARILAKAMNCKEGPTRIPCNTCQSCNEITSGSAVDVYEIDGASNNSVDQIRELRDNIKYMPAHSLYKIYIIDEVHMLSIAAFNALLKTLEEPPEHVMFLFATTEAHKIPITILSRCQQYDFRRIDVTAIVDHLKMISTREGSDFDGESMTLIAREAGGSMRDALSLMDQVMACVDGEVTSRQVVDILGIVDRKTLFDLSSAMLSGNVPGLIDLVGEAYDQGYELKKLFMDLLEHFRNLLIVKIGRNTRKLVDLPGHEIELMQQQVDSVSPIYLNQLFDMLFREEATIRLSGQPRMAMEMVFFKLLQIPPALAVETLIEKLDRLKLDMGGSIKDRMEPPAASSPALEAGNNTTARENTVSGPLPGNDAAGSEPIVRTDNKERGWDRFLEAVSEKHPSIAPSLAKSTLKHLDKKQMVIGVPGNGFTANMIKKHLGSIQAICRDVFGTQIKVVTEMVEIKDEDKKKNIDARAEKDALGNPLVAEALEIFNGRVIDVKTV